MVKRRKQRRPNNIAAEGAPRPTVNEPNDLWTVDFKGWWKAGDGGRKDALEDLNADGVSLASAPLEEAYLPRVVLKNADLRHANLQGADLQGADLEGANLWEANLQNASLFIANLQDASLSNINLQGAFLQLANLQGANLGGANLQGAKLYADLRGADLQDADLRGARDLTQEQLNAAIGDDSTVLPAGLTRPAHWSKAQAPERPPAAQPDAGEPATAGAGGSGK